MVKWWKWNRNMKRPRKWLKSSRMHSRSRCMGKIMMLGMLFKIIKLSIRALLPIRWKKMYWQTIMVAGKTTKNSISLLMVVQPYRSTTETKNWLWNSLNQKSRRKKSKRRKKKFLKSLCKKWKLKLLITISILGVLMMISSFLKIWTFNKRNSSKMKILTGSFLNRMKCLMEWFWVRQQNKHKRKRLTMMKSKPINQVKLRRINANLNKNNFFDKTQTMISRTPKEKVQTQTTGTSSTCTQQWAPTNWANWWTSSTPTTRNSSRTSTNTFKTSSNQRFKPERRKWWSSMLSFWLARKEARRCKTRLSR